MPTFGVIYLKLYINISTHRNSTHRLPGVGALNASFSKLIRMFLMNSPRYTASTTQDAAGSVYIHCSPKIFHFIFLHSQSKHTSTETSPQAHLCVPGSHITAWRAWERTLQLTEDRRPVCGRSSWERTFSTLARHATRYKGSEMTHKQRLPSYTPCVPSPYILEGDALNHITCITRVLKVQKGAMAGWT